MRIITVSRRTALFFTLCVALPVLWSCQRKTMLPESRLTDSSPGKVAVLPVQNMNAVLGENVGFRCPFSGRSFVTGKVTEGAEAFLTGRMYDMLRIRKSLEVVPPGQALGARSVLLSNQATIPGESEMARKTGEATGSDAVLVGRVYRFDERSGTGYAVKSPASVAFNFVLIDTKSGRLLWEGYFDESQRPLSENLFKIGLFFKRKMRWLTAEELAVDGLEDVLKSFPAQ